MSIETLMERRRQETRHPRIYEADAIWVRDALIEQARDDVLGVLTGIVAHRRAQEALSELDAEIACVAEKHEAAAAAFDAWLQELDRCRAALAEKYPEPRGFEAKQRFEDEARRMQEKLAREMGSELELRKKRDELAADLQELQLAEGALASIEFPDLELLYLVLDEARPKRKRGK